MSNTEHNNLSDENKKCKIFVGNVPYQCNQEEFRNCFKNIDGFIEAEIITINKTNISRGFGFITMKSSECADKLKNRNDIMIKNRLLRFTAYKNIDKNDKSCYNHDEFTAHDKTAESVIFTNNYVDDYIANVDNYVGDINNDNVDNINKDINIFKDNLNNKLYNRNNYVFISGIPNGKNRSWIKKCFNNYEPIGKYFIITDHITGVIKNAGFMEILDNNNYKNIINKRFHSVMDEGNNVILEINRYKFNLISKYN